MGDVDEAFRIWSKTAEQFCIKLALEQGHAIGRKHRGRGTTPKVVSQSIQAPPSTPHEGAAKIRVASLLKLRRRILQLRLKIQHPPHAGSEAFVQMEKIVTNITSTWRRLFHEDVTHSIPPADQQVLPLLKHAESALTTEQEQLQHQRINTFKEYLTKDWNDTRKATYTWLRNREPFVPPCFKASSNNSS